MSMPVAIRFVNGSTTVDFYKDEVLDHPFKTDQRVKFLDPPYWRTIVKKDGSMHRTFMVELYKSHLTTETKFWQIVGWKAVMTMYYFYRNAPTKSAQVILDPENVSMDYDYWRGKNLVTTYEMTFLEV